MAQEGQTQCHASFLRQHGVCVIEQSETDTQFVHCLEHREH